MSTKSQSKKTDDDSFGVKGARKYKSGAIRSSDKDKINYSLLPPRAIRRVASVLTRAAKKRGKWNWRGGQPLSQLVESADRHLMQFKLGETDEDHLSHLACNILFLMEHQESGRTDLDDLRNYFLGGKDNVARMGKLRTKNKN